MTARFRIAPEVAWVEGIVGGGDPAVVWVSHLDTGVQYELTGTGWLIWMLVSDGFERPSALHDELERIRLESAAESDVEADAGAGAVDLSVVEDFLTRLEHDGLLLRDARTPRITRP